MFGAGNLPPPYCADLSFIIVQLLVIYYIILLILYYNKPLSNIYINQIWKKKNRAEFWLKC